MVAPACAAAAAPRYLVAIAGLFSGVLIVSLILAGKIAEVGGVTFTAAVIVFPLSYLFGDVLTEVYGYASARKVVWAGFAVQLIWIGAYWIAAALVSSLSGSALPPETVYFGEIGLSGAIRPVAQASARLKEAQKLGFAKALMPQGRETADRALATEALRHIADMVAGIAANGPKRGGRGRNHNPRYEEAD